ncbi:hypothetical protein F511_12148 [Dorcoceras hygrometricum]|uniref:Uncharacterized protein n=1 Tax=Dorcoceras hygrometricum TaxID=472368 RepID=A0A2Z7C9S4_9LAMI|nr:hypothetical protein F511_12148 [Dorcoceras hygrometricum]
MAKTLAGSPVRKLLRAGRGCAPCEGPRWRWKTPRLAPHAILAVAADVGPPSGESPASLRRLNFASSFRKKLAQHVIVCINEFDDVSHSRHHDVIITFSYNSPNRYDDISSTEVGKWIDMMTSSVLKLAKLLNLVYRDKSLDSKELFIHLLQEEICR